jgi:hypothetical protein
MLLRTVFLALACCAVWNCVPPRASAESFLLKSGGQVDGELLNPKRNAADPYQIRTAGGMRISLRREDIAKVVVTREAELEYERLLPKTPDTAAGHWEMAEWCREQGLRAQREQELRRVLALDPDHEQAHLVLGHAKLGGKWQTMDDYMKSQGYLKHEGQWRTRQDVEIALAREETEAEVIKWRKQINIWKGWLGKKREAEAVTNLRQIRDSHAAPTLIDLLDQKGQSRDLRILLIDVLGDLKGNPAEGAFVKLAVADTDQQVRDACLDQLVRSKSKLAVHQYIGVIKSEKSLPPVINRAAVALGRLKDEIATPALIDALQTTHEFMETPQPAGGGTQFNNSFSSDGSGGLGGGSFGSPKPVKVKRTFQNEQVLSALNTIHPGVTFGFNEPAWRQWYEEKHEPPKVNLRRVQ